MRQTNFRVTDKTIFKDAALQGAMYERGKSGIAQFVMQGVQCDGVWHRIEEILNVEVQYPLGAAVCSVLQSSNGIVRTTAWAISKAVARKARLPTGREDLRSRLLDDAIDHGRNGEKPEAARWFRDAGAA